MRPERLLAAWLGGLAVLLAMPAGAADAETDAKIKALEEQVAGAQHADPGSQDRHGEQVRRDAAADHGDCAHDSQRTSHDHNVGRRLLGVDTLAGAVRCRRLRPGSAADGSRFVERYRLPPGSHRHRRKSVHGLGIQLLLRLRRQRCRGLDDRQRVCSIRRTQSAADPGRRVPAVRQPGRQFGCLRHCCFSSVQP